jgi:hypothetical protein
MTDAKRIEQLIYDLRAVAREITRIQAELISLHASLCTGPALREAAPPRSAAPPSP